MGEKHFLLGVWLTKGVDGAATYKIAWPDSSHSYFVGRSFTAEQFEEAQELLVTMLKFLAVRRENVTAQDLTITANPQNLSEIAAGLRAFTIIGEKLLELTLAGKIQTEN
jgi:hypothetical protein